MVFARSVAFSPEFYSTSIVKLLKNLKAWPMLGENYIALFNHVDYGLGDNVQDLFPFHLDVMRTEGIFIEQVPKGSVLPLL